MYYLSRSDLEVSADALGCAKYYSDLGSEEERTMTFKLWSESSQRVMICTGAFVARVEYASESLVIHVGVPGSALDYVHEVDHEGCHSRRCKPKAMVPQKVSSNIEISEEFTSLKVRRMFDSVGRIRYCQSRLVQF